MGETLFNGHSRCVVNSMFQTLSPPEKGFSFQKKEAIPMILPSPNSQPKEALQRVLSFRAEACRLQQRDGP